MHFANRKLLLTVITTIVVLVVLVFFIQQWNKGRVVGIVTIEVGSTQLEVSQFLLDQEDEGTFVTDLSAINRSIPGVHTIEIQIGKRTYASTLEIIDTTAPVAEAVHHEIWPEEVKQAEDFVTNVVDHTDVKASFATEPDYSKIGDQDVRILLTDTSGNQTEVVSKLTIKADTQPPVITGVVNQEIYADEKISYKKDVVVMDNRDDDVELVIDTSNVSVKTPGTYEVVYSATDSAGNTATATANITIKERPKNYISDEELNALADQVLAQIITDDMTELEKLWEIYKWTRNHIQYTGSSDKSDWRAGAVQGIKRGAGDCFNYYSTSRLLLERAGFENIMVERVGGETLHYWQLVKYEGNWYHFDTTWTRKGYFYITFMKTDHEVAEYTKLVEDYYQFDASLYPATPDEPLEIPFELTGIDRH